MTYAEARQLLDDWLASGMLGKRAYYNAYDKLIREERNGIREPDKVQIYRQHVVIKRQRLYQRGRDPRVSAAELAIRIEAARRVRARIPELGPKLRPEIGILELEAEIRKIRGN